MVVQFALARIDWRRSPVLVLTALGPSVVYVRDDTCAWVTALGAIKKRQDRWALQAPHIVPARSAASTANAVAITARRLQSELASRARLEYELS